MSKRTSTRKRGGDYTIITYKKFKENLGGWSDIAFPVFRELVCPLRDKKEWPDDKKKEITKIVENGGGRAMFVLCDKHPGAAELAKVLKFVGLKENPGPMEDKRVIDGYVNVVLQSCKRDSWTSNLYKEWLMYLESDMEASEIAFGKSSQKDAAFGKSSGDSKNEAEMPDVPDEVAALFRSGSKQCREYMRKRILDAAESAPTEKKDKT